MGDRGNVCVNGVYLYTHNAGKDIPNRVCTALKHRVRWDDAPYLARIIFEALVDEEHGSETGFGISDGIGDSNNPLVTVNCARQQVSYDTGEMWSFSDFIRAPRSTIQFQ